MTILRHRITWLMILVYASVIAFGMAALAVFAVWIGAKLSGMVGL